MSPSNRREARRLALCTLYAQEFTGYSVSETLPLLISLQVETGAWPDFARQLCYAVEQHRDDIARDIQSVLENWRLERVAPLERALLKLGCAEITYFPDIPPRVTINEYIELAKDYANGNAPSFVNGVLDKLSQLRGKRDFRAERPGPKVYSAGAGRPVSPNHGSFGESSSPDPASPQMHSAREPVPSPAGNPVSSAPQISAPEEPRQPAPQPPSAAPALDLSRISSPWAREIYKALHELGGSASTDDLYLAIERRGQIPLTPEWQLIVQGTLERHSADSLSFEGDPENPHENLFKHQGRRQWGLTRH